MVVKVGSEQADSVRSDHSKTAGYLKSVGCLDLADCLKPARYPNRAIHLVLYQEDLASCSELAAYFELVDWLTLAVPQVVDLQKATENQMRFLEWADLKRVAPDSMMVEGLLVLDLMLVEGSVVPNLVLVEGPLVPNLMLLERSLVLELES